MREKLNQIMGNDDILVFTDGSALNNPGPTGAGALIYLESYEANSILLKKSNKYTGELIGIQMGPSRSFGDLGRMAIYFQGSREHW